MTRENCNLAVPRTVPVLYLFNMIRYAHIAQVRPKAYRQTKLHAGQ